MAKKIYPKIIDSLGLTFEFDEAKWALYLLQCDDTPRSSRNEFPFSVPISFSQMELKFDSLSSKQDTIDLFFTFYYRNTSIHNCANIDIIKEITDDKRVIKGNDSIVWYLYRCASIQDCKIGPVDPAKLYQSSDRLANPQQPEVVKYLNDHKKILDPWLYSEAVRRNVIKDSL